MQTLSWLLSVMDTRPNSITISSMVVKLLLYTFMLLCCMTNNCKIVLFLLLPSRSAHLSNTGHSLLSLYVAS